MVFTHSFEYGHCTEIRSGIFLQMSKNSDWCIPDYWKECTSRSGQKYYFNVISKESIWEKPVASQNSNWVRKVSKTKKQYYLNTKTLKSQWSKPFGWVEKPKETDTKKSVNESTKHLEDINMPKQKYNSNYSNWERQLSYKNRNGNNPYNQSKPYHNNIRQSNHQRSRVYEDVSLYQHRNIPQAVPMRARRAASVGREITFRESYNSPLAFNKKIDAESFRQLKRENSLNFMRNVPKNAEASPNNEQNSQIFSSPNTSKVSPLINRIGPRTCLGPEKSSAQKKLKVSSTDGTSHNVVNESTSPNKSATSTVKRKSDTREESSCVSKRTRITFEISDQTVIEKVEEPNINSPEIPKRPKIIRPDVSEDFSISTSSITIPKVTSSTFLSSKNNEILNAMNEISPLRNRFHNNQDDTFHNDERSNNQNNRFYNNQRPNYQDNRFHIDQRPHIQDNTFHNNQRTNNQDNTFHNDERPNNQNNRFYNNQRPNHQDNTFYNNQRPNNQDIRFHNNQRPNNQANRFHIDQKPSFHNNRFQNEKKPRNLDDRFHNYERHSYQKNKNAFPYWNNRRNSCDNSSNTWPQYQNWNKPYNNQEGPNVRTLNEPTNNSCYGNQRAAVTNESLEMKNIQDETYQSKRISDGLVSTVEQSSIEGKETEAQGNIRGTKIGVQSSIGGTVRRTPAQDRMQRIMKSLSVPSTPKNQSNLQQTSPSHSWPRQNSSSQSENISSPTTKNYHHNLMSPKNQNSSENYMSQKINNTPENFMSQKIQNAPENFMSPKIHNTPPNSEKAAYKSSQEYGGVITHLGGNNSWGSPIARERSNSASSGMSVDSPSSSSFSFLEANRKLKETLSLTPTAQPSSNITPNDVSATLENNMEWEPISVVIEKKIEEVRRAVNPHQESIRIPPTKPLDLAPSANKTRLVLVLDTNVFLGSLEFVTRARDKYTHEHGYVLLYVPWQVVQELDSIKDRCTADPFLKKRVMKAIHFIEASLLHRNPRIVFQDQDTMEKSNKVLKHETPDDRILAACLQLRIHLATVRHTLVLVSEDVNLRSKAMISNVKSESVAGISEVIFNRKAMPQDTMPVSEQDKKIQSDLDIMFCHIKDKLFEVMSEVLTDAIKMKMSGLPWEKGVMHKPPWDWSKLFRNYEHHQVSFVKLITCHDTRLLLPIIKALKSVIMKHEEDSEVTLDNLKRLLRESGVFASKLKHPTQSTFLAQLRAIQTQLNKVEHSCPEAKHPETIKKHLEDPNPVIFENQRVSPACVRPKAEPGERQKSTSSDCVINTNNIASRTSSSITSPTSTSITSPTSSSITSRTSSSITSPTSSSASDATSSPVEIRNKIFNLLNTVYIQMELFRLSVHKFLNMDTQSDYSQIPDITINDLVDKFENYRMHMCRLGLCLEKIFGDPEDPPPLLPTSFSLREFSQTLTQLTQKSFTPQQLISALREPTFYAQMTRQEGLKQFQELCERFEILAPMVESRVNLERPSS